MSAVCRGGGRGPQRLATLPGTVARLARLARLVQQWSLTVEAPFVPGGQTAWAALASDPAGAERVLKVA